MFYRKIVQHLRDQNWGGIAVDFVIVVIGVYVGLQAQEWSNNRADRQRLERIVAALTADMRDGYRVEQSFRNTVRTGLAAFDAAYQRGERPKPFVFRIEGSDTAPNLIWGTLQEAGLGELLDPQLLFELNHFFSERQGIGVKTTRYMESIETLILPYLDGDPAYFYQGEAMRPEFLATMERLREWVGYLDQLGPWSACLQKRLESASEPGGTCSNQFTFTNFGE
ncbi:MAG: hypothetical protein AAGA23_12950 [Pseudomonadota bacterium]